MIPDAKTGLGERNRFVTGLTRIITFTTLAAGIFLVYVVVPGTIDSNIWSVFSRMSGAGRTGILVYLSMLIITSVLVCELAVRALRRLSSHVHTLRGLVYQVVKHELLVFGWAAGALLPCWAAVDSSIDKIVPWQLRSNDGTEVRWVILAGFIALVSGTALMGLERVSRAGSRNGTHRSDVE